MPCQATPFNHPPQRVQPAPPASPHCANTRRGTPCGCPVKQPRSTILHNESSQHCANTSRGTPCGCPVKRRGTALNHPPQRVQPAPPASPHCANTRRGTPSGLWVQPAPPACRAPVGAPLVGALSSNRLNHPPQRVQPAPPASPHCAPVGAPLVGALSSNPAQPFHNESSQHRLPPPIAQTPVGAPLVGPCAQPSSTTSPASTACLPPLRVGAPLVGALVSDRSTIPRNMSSHHFLPPPTPQIPVGAPLVGALASDRACSSLATCYANPVCPLRRKHP